DWYENGTDNVYISFYSGNIGYDEEGNLVGTGLSAVIDFCAEPVTTDDTDHLHLADFAGTYTLGSDYAAGQVSVDDSYIYHVVNGESVYESDVFEELTMVISPSDKGVKVTVTAKVDGKDLNINYEGPDYVISAADGTLGSNIPADVKFDGIVGASVINFGDFFETGAVDTWAISLGDSQYDFDTDFGFGESMFIYLNAASGSEELPEGHYAEFIDFDTAEEVNAGSLIGGISLYGMYMGCFYFNTGLSIEGSLVDGYVDVTKKGENYLISGELEDAYGKKVTFSYEGDLMYYELVEEYSTLSTKSASFSKYAKKSPLSFKK
ncbi:MAG: hypothetical protein ACI4TL_06825, partial [Candidatus Cryptobacteroides sp.]